MTFETLFDTVVNSLNNSEKNLCLLFIDNMKKKNCIVCRLVLLSNCTCVYFNLKYSALSLIFNLFFPLDDVVAF